MALSARGQAAIQPAPIYIQRAFAAWNDEYDASTNPDGYINLAVAENLLSLGHVARKLSEAPPVPRSSLNYGTPSSFNAVIATFMSKHIMQCPVRPEHVTVMNGAGSVLDAMATVCCDSGDKVLVTGPGYRGLEWDVSFRAEAELVTAALDETAADGDPVISVQALEAAWVREGAAESGIKMVIICSPNNPTGEVLSMSTVQDIVAWGREKGGLHMVFDELYAKSVYAKDATFYSVAEALGGVLGDDVHIVWSFSKDFCISGARMGVLYTQNAKITESVSGTMAMMSGTSRHTQWAIEHMLQDENWISEYFHANAERLRAVYEWFTAFLDEIGVPYMPASAGFFLWIDLRKWMAGNTAEDEMELWERMYQARVVLTPGSECFARRFGYFRVCFAAVDRVMFELAWKRLSTEVLVRKKVE